MKKSNVLVLTSCTRVSARGRFRATALACFLALPLASSLAACKKRAFNQSSAKSSGSEGALITVPQFPRDVVLSLVPPRKETRRADGGVAAKVLYAPEGDRDLLPGAEIVVSWVVSDSFARKTLRGIEIPAANTEAFLSGKKKDILPWALDGWKIKDGRGVSPLESLAGARSAYPEGQPTGDAPVDVRFSLIGSQFSGGVLSVVSAPVVVEGTHTALVRIDAVDAKGENLVLTQYDTGTRGFTAKVTDTVRFGPHAPLKTQEADIPAFDPRGAAASPMNALGWYAHGVFVETKGQPVFEIRSMEPRAVTAVNAGFEGGLYPVELLGDSARGVRDFFAKVNWTDGNGVSSRAEVANSASPAEEASPDIPRGAVAPNGLRRTVLGQGGVPSWKEGQRGLLVHVFSWRGKAPDQTKQTQIVPNSVTGHFAFGTATVVKSPFVENELKFDVTYHQLYGQGPDGIVAANHSWSSYMGSVQRGISFQVPVSDFVVRLPWLTDSIEIPGAAGGAQKLVFLDELEKHLEVMMALYRNGDGDGVSTIDPVTSCVQDSNFALYLTYMPLIDALAKLKPTGNAAADQQVAAGLAALRDLQSFQFGFFKNQPSHWRAALGDNGVIKLNMSTWERVKTFPVQRKTAVPRGSHDALARFFHKLGAQMWIMRQGQVGGGHAKDLKNPDLAYEKGPRVYGYVPDVEVLDVLFGPK